jgi:hypothetical protein
MTVSLDNLAAHTLPNRHELGQNQVLLGHTAGLSHGGSGHTSWHCRTCDTVVYGPPMAKHCTAMEAPAGVRLSNRVAGAKTCPARMTSPKCRLTGVSRRTAVE